MFLDANIVFSAAYRYSSVLRLLWSLGSVKLLSSEYAIDEVRRNLGGQYSQALEHLLIPMLISTPPDSARPIRHPGLDLPPKDLPIFQAAKEANATHLLTGDRKHFGRYFGLTVDGVHIMLPADYLRSRGVLS